MLWASPPLRSTRCASLIETAQSVPISASESTHQSTELSPSLVACSLLMLAWQMRKALGLLDPEPDDELEVELEIVGAGISFSTRSKLSTLTSTSTSRDRFQALSFSFCKFSLAFCCCLILSFLCCLLLNFLGISFPSSSSMSTSSPSSPLSSTSPSQSPVCACYCRPCIIYLMWKWRATLHSPQPRSAMTNSLR